ncbi:SAM-dependent methyltransferase [Actinoplanes sp. NPDC048967]|uniref:SAM-dependent methyltransferase n=1 Tax=Actinoplanes sp. NPDC048967 TaxID=3155269 RepID=UPI0033E29DB4
MTDPTQLNADLPHSARVWNYLLGGKDNFAADREAADYAVRLMPELVLSARANRQFLGRAVRFLAGEGRIRQFLDVGTGLPTADNTHEVAQAVAPDARVVYVDNDPLVLTHARALLTSSPQGATDYLAADVRDPQAILRAAATTLDFGRPAAVVLSGILNFVMDDAEARSVVEQFMAAVPAGSFLLISHPTTEVNGEAVEESMRQWNESGAAPIRTRTIEEIRGFFAGLELLEPGVVTCTAWRPDPRHPGITEVVSEFVAVGRKP